MLADLENCVTSGTAGDDRRLTQYALQHGLVLTALSPVFYAWVLFVVPHYTGSKVMFLYRMGYWVILTYLRWACTPR
ncbi:hypothetical protein [Streptomyces sp. NPDC007206]|uniref:hypothetical protein n=1 Tax=Streptomyces sp. NPDC007206 TaxID=3154317 RepID=UPI0033D1B591